MKSTVSKIQTEQGLSSLQTTDKTKKIKILQDEDGSDILK